MDLDPGSGAGLCVGAVHVCVFMSSMLYGILKWSHGKKRFESSAVKMEEDSVERSHFKCMV